MVPSDIDQEKLMIQLSRLEEHTDKLKEIRKKRTGEKSEDILICAAERLLQMAIEDCLNIGSHIISGMNFRRSDTYKEIFFILKENKVISDKLADSMAHLASFRNRLVYIYWEVKPDEIDEKLKDINIFRKYAEEILRFVKNRKK